MTEISIVDSGNDSAPDTTEKSPMVERSTVDYDNSSIDSIEPTIPRILEIAEEEFPDLLNVQSTDTISTTTPVSIPEDESESIPTILLSESRPDDQYNVVHATETPVVDEVLSEIFKDLTTME